jgi:hypothetical protein
MKIIKILCTIAIVTSHSKLSAPFNASLMVQRWNKIAIY